MFARNARAIEGVVFDNGPQSAFLDINVLSTDTRADAVASDDVIVAVFVIFIPLAGCGADVNAFTVTLSTGRAGIMDIRVLNYIVRTCIAKVNAFIPGIEHLNALEKVVIRTIQNDAFLSMGHREILEIPVVALDMENDFRGQGAAFEHGGIIRIFASHDNSTASGSIGIGEEVGPGIATGGGIAFVSAWRNDDLIARRCVLECILDLRS